MLTDTEPGVGGELLSWAITQNLLWIKPWSWGGEKLNLSTRDLSSLWLHTQAPLPEPHYLATKPSCLPLPLPRLRPGCKSPLYTQPLPSLGAVWDVTGWTGRNDSCLRSWAGQHGLILLAGSRESNPPTPTPALSDCLSRTGSVGPSPQGGGIGDTGRRGPWAGGEGKRGVSGKPWSRPHPRMRA